MGRICGNIRGTSGIPADMTNLQPKIWFA